MKGEWAAMNTPLKTYPFMSQIDGRQVRLVESQPHEGVPQREGSYFIESSDGAFIDWANITGPEILKLSAQGRALWNILSKIVRHMPANAPHYLDAKEVLGNTAAAFDHNEE